MFAHHLGSSSKKLPTAAVKLTVSTSMVAITFRQIAALMQLLMLSGD